MAGGGREKAAAYPNPKIDHLLEKSKQRKKKRVDLRGDRQRRNKTLQQTKLDFVDKEPWN